jgi:hypothetical protein
MTCHYKIYYKIKVLREIKSRMIRAAKDSLNDTLQNGTTREIEKVIFDDVKEGNFVEFILVKLKIIDKNPGHPVWSN